MTPVDLPLLDRFLLRLVRGPGAEFVVGDILERRARDLADGVDPALVRARTRRQVLGTLVNWLRPRARRARRLGAAHSGSGAGPGGADGLNGNGNGNGRGAGMGAMMQDLRMAWRGVRRRPGFAFGVALTLGLGIGATTTIYSVVQGVLLEPLAFDDPGSLVAVGTTFPGREWEDGSTDLQHLAGTSVANFVDLEERARSFRSLAAVEQMSILLTDQGDGPELVSSAAATEGFFPTLGVTPVLGRTFLPEEYVADGPEALLITYGAWQRRFGGDPSIVGQGLDKVGLPTTIVGVLPPDFEPPEAFFSAAPEFWAPLKVDHARYAQRGRRSAFLIGRLAPGVTVETARVEAQAIADELAKEFPDGNVYPNGTWFGIGVNGLHEETVGTTGRTLWIFMGASSLLLLLAALNAATLLLARALDRVRELGIRVALGAGRGRVLRLMLVEAGLLSLFGGMVGIVIAYGGVELFLRYAPSSIPRTDMVSVDAGILAVAAIVSLGAGLAAGLFPAARLSAPMSGAQGRRTVTEPGSRLRAALVGGQVSLAVVLLAGAGLMFTSFVKIRSVEPGFEPDGLMSMNVAVKRPGAPPGELAWQAWDTALAELSAVPGVEQLAGTSNPPFQDPYWAPRLLLEGDPPETWREGIAGYSVSPGYFEVVGTPLLAGREFEATDGPDTEHVAVVNEEFVRTQLDGADPLGMEIYFSEGDDRTPIRIVGVVANVVQARADQGPRPAVYTSHRQQDWSFLQVVIRSPLPLDVLMPDLRRAVARFNAYVPPSDVMTLEARMASTRTTPRFQAMLIGAFALVAMFLAAAGLYGSLTHAVGRRRRELGVRVALGAERGGLVMMVLKQGLRVSLVGLAVGIGAALLGTRVLGGFLYEVEPTDPATFAGVAALLATVAVLACLRPALRATAVDPIEVLKEE